MFKKDNHFYIYFLFHTLIAIAAICFLLMVDLTPQTFNGNEFSFFIIIGVILNMGYVLYIPIANLIIKDDVKFTKNVIILIGSVFYTFSVCITKENWLYLPGLAINCAVAMYCFASCFLPSVPVPMKTQIERSKEHFMYVLDIKEHGYSLKFAQSCWESYVHNVRDTAKWRQHMIPENENFQPINHRERKDILNFVTKVHLMQSAKKS